MTAPIRYLIAEVVPCLFERRQCASDRTGWCSGCNGDGTRTVVTDVEVTPDDDVSAERDRLRSQIVMLVAALEMIRDGNRDPISLAEIGLREAGL